MKINPKFHTKSGIDIAPAPLRRGATERGDAPGITLCCCGSLFFLMILMILGLPGVLPAQTPSAEEILKRVDNNRTSESKIVVAKMVIHGRRGSRTVVSKSWQRNLEESFTEYLAPARDKGTKMLKLEDRLWTYSPSTDRTILISGHLLRQSVMGSDLSYEDMMEDPKLANLYTAEIIAGDTLRGRPVWQMMLTAKNDDASYDKLEIWVDRERFVLLRENLYAKSGKLLKTVEISDMMKVEGRWVAKKALFKDVLKSGKGTEMMIESIEFGKKIPNHIFSKASLRR